MARGGRNRQRRNNKKSESSETPLDSSVQLDSHSGDSLPQETTSIETPPPNDHNDHDTYETQTFGYLSDKPTHPFGPSFEELPLESIDYFKEIEKKLDLGFDSPDDLEVFLENVFSEVLDKEVQVSVHPEVAVVVEKLLKWGNEFQLRIFWDRLSGNYLNLFRHVFGSHVCQTLLTLAADVVEKEVRGESSVQNGPTDGQENGDNGVLLPMQDLIVNMCKELSSHYLTLLHDRYATYLIRVLLSLLSGTPIVIDNVKSKKSKKWGQERNHYSGSSSSSSNTNGPSNSRFKKPQKKLVPMVFKECLNMILEEINEGLMLTGGKKNQDGSGEGGESGESRGKSDVVIRSLAFSKIVNPVLQQLLELPQSEENRLSLVKRFLMMPESEGEEESPAELKARTNYVNGLLKDTVGSHLLEKILKYADQTTLSYLYTHHFKTKLMSLSFHQIANYIVQSFLNSIKDPNMLKEVVEEMKNGFEGLLFNGKPAIVAKLFDACVRLNCCHEDVLNALFNVLRLDTEEKQERGSWFCILYMISYEDLEASVPTRQRFPHPLGAQILQSILSFPSIHHHSVVLNFLNLDISTWVHHLTHSAGSLTFEYFLKSKTVEYDLKKTVIENIVHYQTPSPQQETPLLVTLSLDKFGCHVLDHIYSYSDIELKYSICKVLLNHEKKILGSNNMYGKIIWRNLKMEVFKKKVQMNGPSDSNFKSGNTKVQVNETKSVVDQSQVKQVELVEQEWVKSQEKLIQQKKEWVDMFSEFGVELGLNGVDGTKVSSKEQDKSKQGKKSKKEKKDKKDKNAKKEKKEKKEKKRKLSETVEGDGTVEESKKKKKKSKKE